MTRSSEEWCDKHAADAMEGHYAQPVEEPEEEEPEEEEELEPGTLEKYHG
jgi:hypothetical protein